MSILDAEPREASMAVTQGEADLGLVFGYDGPPRENRDLIWHPLSTEPVDLVLPPEHAAYARPDVQLAGLTDEAWIGGCVRCRQHLVDRCRAAGFEPRLVHESDDYVVVQNLIAAGLGVTLLPRSALQAFRHPAVVVRDSPTFGVRHCGLVFRPGAEQVPATRALIERLRRVAAEQWSGAAEVG